MAFTNMCCRSGGSNLNAGSLLGDLTEPGTSPSFIFQNGSWVNGTRVFTVASGTTSGVVAGMFASVYPDGGTPPNVSAFLARVSSVASTTITCAAGAGTSPATSGSTTLVIGGALLGPGGTSGFPLTLSGLGSWINAAGSPCRINLKNDQTYNVTASIAVASTALHVEGYTSVYGDGGRATIDGGTTGAAYVLQSHALITMLRSLIFQNNGATGNASLVTHAGRFNVENCVFRNSRGNGFTNTLFGTLVGCEAYNCNQSNTTGQGGFAPGGGTTFIRCVAHDNSGSNTAGFFTIANAQAKIIECIIDSNGGYGVSVGASNAMIVNSTFYNNPVGITCVNGSTLVVVNNILSNCTSGIVMANTSTNVLVSRNNAFFSNTADLGSFGSAGSSVSGSVALTASPFVNPVSGDFALNATSGGGLNCRGTGYFFLPQADPAYTASTSASFDIGAVRHYDTSGVAAYTGQSTFIF